MVWGVTVHEAGQLVDGHPAEGAGDIQDFGLAVAQAHGGTSDAGTGRIVLRFRGLVNEADWSWLTPMAAKPHSARP